MDDTIMIHASHLIDRIDELRDALRTQALAADSLDKLNTLRGNEEMAVRIKREIVIMMEGSHGRKRH